MSVATNQIDVDTDAAISRLLRLLAVPGVTGDESAIASTIQQELLELGVPVKAMRYDDANKRIPEPTPTGNLIVTLPGTSKKTTKPLLFATHMDTVPLCAGAKPVRKEQRIVNEAPTALGGDNRTGCAVLVTLAAELLRHKLPHPPIKLLFTVREESGLYGAKYLNLTNLGDVAMGFNFDGRSATDVIVGAIGADRWNVDIHGRASHAGVSPEKGISATMIFSLALAEVYEGGWWGKIVKDGREGTSNIGIVTGGQGGSVGDATNVVTDFLRARGESRSHDAKFVREITTAFKNAFRTAARRVKDHKGRPGKVKFISRLDYLPFRLKNEAPVVKRAIAAVTRLGLNPNLRTTNGGLDANWLVKHGIPTVTFGAGQNEIHTIHEYVDLDEFENACRLALILATLP